MHKVAKINTMRCDQSPFCPVKRVCPVNAVKQDNGLFKRAYPTIDPNVCTGCEKCLQYCPMNAVEMKSVT